jgi:quercetin dioxygenase-like cupin family protein
MSEPNPNVSPVPGALLLDLEAVLLSSRQHKPWQSGMFAKLLLKADDLRMVLMSLESGARIKEHQANGTISIHCLQGSLSVQVQGEAHDVIAGQVLTVLGGLKHDVAALADSAFLLTISWRAAATPGTLRHEGDAT